MHKESRVLQMNSASKRSLGNSEASELRTFLPVHRQRSALFDRLRTEVSIVCIIIEIPE